MKKNREVVEEESYDKSPECRTLQTQWCCLPKLRLLLRKITSKNNCHADEHQRRYFIGIKYKKYIIPVRYYTHYGTNSVPTIVKLLPK